MITSTQMRELEEAAYEQGLSPQELMENAGEQVYRAIKQRYGIELTNKRLIIFAGQGNNGGDGFVIARHFAEDKDSLKGNLPVSNSPVLILFFGDKQKLSEEALVMYEKVRKKANIIPIRSAQDLQHFQVQDGFQLLLIDALLGTGVKGKVREPLASAIAYFNSLPGIKVAVDIPSGIDPDTGRKNNDENGDENSERNSDKKGAQNNEYCEVDLIVTFHDLKAGLQGLENWQEKTVVVDIGIPG